MRMFHKPAFHCYILLLSGLLFGSSTQSEEKDALAAMKKATDFMMKVVSNRGGFLFHYSEDLSRGWGEVPARKSQIWVQPPSTPTVGMMLIDAYQATGDRQYLEYAGRVAGALIWGQHPDGGWHYFIDFDPAGVEQWYDEVASQCRGWEEFYHYYGNCTYDDDTTASPTRFLLRLYEATQDAKYRPPLLKALKFIVESQYENGAWPQRWPPTRQYPQEGRADYTSFYTYNDDVIANNIYVLVEAYEKLGDDEYLKAARRGMDFYLVSQLESPQAGWAQQYDLELKPGWARSYEPAALCSSQTVENIRDLENFYRITGDRRYLEPIPKALQWLRGSIIYHDPAKKFTHATYYEVGTNKPLYARHLVRYGKISAYKVGYEEFDLPAYGGKRLIDVEALESEFNRIKTLQPEAAKAELDRNEFSQRRVLRVNSQEITTLIKSLDSRGAWVTDIEFLDTDNYADNPPLKFRGIDTRTYVSNMYKLISFLKSN